MTKKSLHAGNPFAELIKILKQVDTDSPLATLNETTISDNNGGRIILWPL